MANPKRRHSFSRGAKREAQTWKLDTPTYVLCPNCRHPKLPHFVCPNCGFYKDTKIYKTRAEIKEEKKKKE